MMIDGALRYECVSYLKGEYEDYTWTEPSMTIPFREYHFQSVHPIYSTIAKRTLVRTLIFHIFTNVENKLLKLKRRIIWKYLTFSHSLNYRKIYCFIKIHYFLFNYYTHSFLWYDTGQKESYGALILLSVWTWKFLTLKWKSTK